MDERREDLAKFRDLSKLTVEKPIESTVGLAEVDAHLKEFRSVCEQLVLDDIVYAKSNSVENSLWAAHSRVNTFFRKQLSLSRKNNLTKPVELHKFIKLYLSFLKDSQRFYRQFIQGLNATYGAIPELQQIAQTDQLEAKALSSQTPEVRRETLLSCHRSLIYLGDLSRYRATEKLDKEPAWGPAVGYYTLAATLRPVSGMAYHQLSVIALEESDHLRAIYYLYRAIVVDEPHPIALDNLELEFRKVRRAWDAGVDLPKNTAGNDPSKLKKILSAWFVRLHCGSFQGQRTASHAELLTEVQNHLSRQLQATSVDVIVSKLCYINFAAQKTAADRFEGEPGNSNFLNSYFCFLEINIKTMLTLLDRLTNEIDCLDGDASRSLKDPKSQSLQSLLPILRLYSAWLLTNSKIMVSDVGDERINNELAKFWIAYANAMSVLAAAFPVEDLPEVNYQLPEDVESFAFKPIESRNTLRTWYDGENKLPDCTKIGDLRLEHSNEQLARIRGLLIDALLLAVADDDPLIFDGKCFVAKDSRARASARRQQVSRPPPGLTQQPVTSSGTSSRASLAPPVPVQGEQETVRRMSEMVDNLVGVDMEDPASHRLQADTLARRLSQLNTTPQHRSGSADSTHRMQSVSSLWGYESPLQSHTPQPESQSQRAMAQSSRGHTRVNSASSFHSIGSGQVAALSSSFIPTPPVQGPSRLSTDLGPSRLSNSALSGYDSGMNSPLLFGTGGVWSARPRRSIQNDTPPNGQGG